MKKYLNMQIIFASLLILAYWQFVKGNTSTEEFYDPNEDNGELMLKMLFTKLNALLEQNMKINQNLIELNKRQDLQEKNMKTIMEHSKSDQCSLNETNLNLIFSKNTQQIIKHLSSNQCSLNETNPNLKSAKSKTDWTVIQRRQDGSVDFFRNWADYKQGFGNENGEFFIGLERLHHMTHYGTPHELLIVLTDFNNQTRTAKYDKFLIGSEFEKYSLKELGKYSGDAGDSLSPLKGKKFSTKDQQNDENSVNCAEFFKGAWWFDKCFINACHLNGPYQQNSTSRNSGIVWLKWHGGDYSLKSVEMMIRPIKNSN